MELSWLAAALIQSSAPETYSWSHDVNELSDCILSKEIPPSTDLKNDDFTYYLLWWLGIVAVNLEDFTAFFQGKTIDQNVSFATLK